MKCGSRVCQFAWLRSRHGWAVRAQPLPAAVLDLHPGGAGAPGQEADLHLGGTGAIPAEVPQVGQPGRRLPDGHLAPVVLGAVGGPLVDPAAHAALQDDRLGAPGHGVIGRPPGADAGGPDGERVVGRAGHVEGHAQRFGHSVFSAISRNRRAASPQTRSRYSWTALQPLLAQVVDPAGAPRLLGDQAGLLQQPQVPGDRGTADGQGRGDVPDRLVALAEQAEDVTPVRVAERLERVAGGVGNHRATVTRRLPKRQGSVQERGSGPGLRLGTQQTLQ